MNGMGTIVPAAFACATAFSQAAQPKLEFEVASIRPSQTSGADRVDIGLHIDGQLARITSLAIRDYLAMAYRVKGYQITGPDWIASDRYDVRAKLPEGSTSDQIPAMLQSLLQDRFQLKLHREKKDLPVYALVVKRPLKLQESASDAASDAPAQNGSRNVSASGSASGVSVDLGNGSYYTFADGKFEIKKVTIDTLARQLERYVDRPIVDMTGLNGTYDLRINVAQEDYQTMLIRAAVNSGVVLPPQALQVLDNGSIASLMDGLQQLGLKMDTRKAPLDMLVVDRISKTPTEN